MAKTTITQFPAGQSQYRIEFDYLARPFVVVTLVNSADQTQNKVLRAGADYRFLNPTLIEVMSPQTGFDTLRIHRQTDTELIVGFRDGSVLTANDLTNAELQAIHISEEGRNQTVDLAKEYADAAAQARNDAEDARDSIEQVMKSGLYGYTLVEDFQKGATLSHPAEALRWTLPDGTGEYYRWDGVFPKLVPAGSTPASSGGVGLGAWVSIGDASLRGNLANPAYGDGLVASQLPNSPVARTVHDKMLEAVSIADYMVGGDVAGAIIGALSSTAGRVSVPAGNHIATPSAAQVAGVLSALSRLNINGSLTIRLPKGRVNLSSPVLVELDGGNNLSIEGQPNVPVTITGQASVSGSAGNYQVTLNVSSTAGVSVGDFLHTNQATGTGACDLHRGVWEITAVEAGSLTVRNTCQLASFPANTITSSSSRVLTSVLMFDRCDGFIVPSSEVGNMSNFVIAGNSDSYWRSSAVGTTELGTHGLAVGSNTVAVNGKSDNVNPQGKTGGSVTFGQYMGVSGFDQQGIVTELGGSFWGDFTCCCNNKRRGFYSSTASGIRAKQITANGNYLDGVIADIGGDIYSGSSSCAAGNGSSGISAAHNGSVIWDSGKASYNKLNGANGVAGGFLQMTGSTMQGNVATGANLAYGAILYCDNSQISLNGTYGINCQLGSVVRGPNCTYIGNNNQGIRGSYNATVTFTGSTFSGNSGGDFLFTAMSLGIFGNTNYGGDIVATDIKLVNQSTGKGVRLTGTSGGDNIVMSYDVTGNGSFVEGYNFRSGDVGIYPSDDAVRNIGRPANRFNIGFFAGGTQSTSDARLKDPIRDFSEAELKAAVACSKSLGFWTWLDDDSKRLHAGTTVQRVLEILEDNGLDWREYGFIGFDSWEDEYKPVVAEIDGMEYETGEVVKVVEAGSLWQLRDQEFDRFLIRGLSARLSAIEKD